MCSILGKIDRNVITVSKDMNICKTRDIYSQISNRKFIRLYLPTSSVWGGGLFRCTLIVPLLLTVLRQTYHKHSLKFFLFVEWNMYHFHTVIMSIIWSNIVIDRNPLPFPLRFEDLIYFNGFTHHPFHFADDTQVSHWNSSLITTTSWISSLVCFTSHETLKPKHFVSSSSQLCFLFASNS